MEARKILYHEEVYYHKFFKNASTFLLVFFLIAPLTFSVHILMRYSLDELSLVLSVTAVLAISSFCHTGFLTCRLYSLFIYPVMNMTVKVGGTSDTLGSSVILMS